MTADELVADFQRMYRERWPYQWGAAEEGCVDCSGAFVYAYRLHGQRIAHGSNAIARQYIQGEILPISEAKPGMIAFKDRNPGEKGYDLADKYKRGGASFTGDLDDHYHVGLVDADPRYVLHAKGEKYGFCRDRVSRESGWDGVAYLKAVEYGQERGKKEAGKVKVVIAGGDVSKPIHMRAAGSTGSSIVDDIPQGAEAELIEGGGTWNRISWNGKKGYVMSVFVHKTGADTGTGEETVNVSRADLEKVYDIIGDMLGKRG